MDSKIEGHCIAMFGDLKVRSRLSQKKFVLNLAASSGLEDFLDETEKEDKREHAQVVSILGGATVGKSTLTRGMMDSENLLVQGDGGPRVLQKATDGPTTSGCWHYRSSDRRGIHYFDMEGMDGSDVLPTDVGRYNPKPSRSFQPDVPPEAERISPSDEGYFDARGYATKEHLPRLAYICSDVLIFVSNHNVWARKDVYKEIIRAAQLAAPAGVCSIQKPHCVVVWNQATSKQEVGEDDTARFLERHDKQKLFGRYYRSMTVLRVHNWAIDKDQFRGDLARFKKTVNTKLEESLQFRKEMGLLYNSFSLARLISVALSRFHTTSEIWFDTIISEILLAQDDKIATSRRLFFQLYQTPRDYEFACRVASRFLACQLRLFACSFQDPSMIENATNVQNEENSFGQLSNELDQYSPCGQGCVLLKCRHGDFHQSRDMETWEGTFSGKGFPKSASENDYVQTLQALDKYGTENAAFRGLVEICTYHKKSIDAKWCAVCLDPVSLDYCLPCLHPYCQRCVKMLPEVTSQFGFSESVLKLKQGNQNTMCVRCIQSRAEQALTPFYLLPSSGERLDLGNLQLSSPCLEQFINPPKAIVKPKQDLSNLMRMSFAPSKVIIYTSGGPAQKLKEIQKIFVSYDVNEGDIRVVKAQDDGDIKAFLSESESKKGGKWSLEEGVIVIGKKAVGNLKDLEKIHQDGEGIVALLSGDEVADNDDDEDEGVELGYVHLALNAGEYVFRSFWESRPVEDTEGLIAEFEVVHTNWYYRKYHRLIRFYEDRFDRVHPVTKVSKASRPYSAVEFVTITDEKNIVIEYNDQSSPDFVGAQKVSIDQIIDLIKGKNPKVEVSHMQM